MNTVKTVTKKFCSTAIVALGVFSLTPSLVKVEARSNIGINLNAYCSYKYPTYRGGRAVLVGRNKNYKAWRCREYYTWGWYWPYREHSINMNNVCKWQTKKENATAYTKNGSTHSHAWRCKY